MTGPVLRRDGDAIIWLWEEADLGIGFDQIRESSDGLHAEVWIQSGGNTEGSQKGHFHWSRLNISSIRARSEIARALTVRNSKIDWHGLLELACLKTAELWRQGEPVVNLGHLSSDEDDRYLIDRLLPEGESTVIFADGGSGKSYLALALGIAVRHGICLPSRLKPLQQGNVLYLDWETNARVQAKRAQWLIRGFGLSEAPGIFYRPMYRTLPDDIARIRQEVMRHDVILVIIDSLGPACGGEPESAEVMLRVFNAMRGLSPATRLVLSHVSRAGAELKNGAARPFGSVYVQNMARSVWELRRGDSDGGSRSNEMAIALYHRKTNEGRLHEPLALRFIFNESTRTIRIVGADVAEDPELAAHASLAYRIREALRHGRMTTTALADYLDVSEGTLTRTLRRMPDVQRFGGIGRGNIAEWGLVIHGNP
ncbi:MAG: AAA family ATPase [Chloroflexi bacterium]|nr:AAA family ATPase [Chloroflexota bacterium]